MRLLLDTCTFLWLITDAPALSARSKELICDPANDVFLSSVSAWEIAIKHGLKQLELESAPEILVPREREAHGVDVLALDEESSLHVARLPMIHKDPFDRMLISQAIVHGMILLSPDPEISRYPVRCLW